MFRALSAARGLAIVRIAFGLYFLVQAYGKTTHGWLSDGQPLSRFLVPQLGHAEPWYRSFLQGTVLPHVRLFAQLVTIGEWVAGLCLFLGIFTPIGALVAIWLNCNYMLLKGLTNAMGSEDRLFVLSALVPAWFGVSMAFYGGEPYEGRQLQSEPSRFALPSAEVALAFTTLRVSGCR